MKKNNVKWKVPYAFSHSSTILYKLVLELRPEFFTPHPAGLNFFCRHHGVKDGFELPYHLAFVSHGIENESISGD